MIVVYNFPQSDETMIAFLIDEGLRLLKNILGHFVVTEYICSESDVTEVVFKDSQIQRPDSELSIGRDARRYVQHIQDLGETDPTSIDDLEEEYDPYACTIGK